MQHPSELKVADAPGKSACALCPDGKTATSGRDGCDACPPGKKSVDGVACSDCGTDTYASNAGSSVCDPCGDGSAPADAFSTCAECAAGRFEDDSAKGACAACPPAKVASNTTPTTNSAAQITAH